MAAVKEDRKKQRKSTVATKKEQTQKRTEETVCINTSLVSEHIMIFIKNWAHILQREMVSWAFILLCGRRTLQKYIYVETLTDGMKVPIR